MWGSWGTGYAPYLEMKCAGKSDGLRQAVFVLAGAADGDAKAAVAKVALEKAPGSPGGRSHAFLSIDDICVYVHDTRIHGTSSLYTYVLVHGRSTRVELTAAAGIDAGLVLLCHVALNKCDLP